MIPEPEIELIEKDFRPTRLQNWTERFALYCLLLAFLPIASFVLFLFTTDLGVAADFLFIGLFVMAILLLVTFGLWRWLVRREGGKAGVKAGIVLWIAAVAFCLQAGYFAVWVWQERPLLHNFPALFSERFHP